MTSSPRLPTERLRLNLTGTTFDTTVGFVAGLVVVGLGFATGFVAGLATGFSVVVVVPGLTVVVVVGADGVSVVAMETVSVAEPAASAAETCPRNIPGISIELTVNIKIKTLDTRINRVFCV
jgi:hypothetical protein